MNSDSNNIDPEMFIKIVETLIDSLDITETDAIKMRESLTKTHGYDSIQFDTSFNKVDVPHWVENKPGYSMYGAYEADSKELFTNYSAPFPIPPTEHKLAWPRVVVVEFLPNMDEDGNSCAKVFFVEEKTGLPFPKMPGIWKEMVKNSENSDIEFEDDGSLRDRGGSTPCSYKIRIVINAMLKMYFTWLEFPNENDYDSVLDLRDHKLLYESYLDVMSSNRIPKKIENLRKEISERQLEIAKLDKELNDICEAAAASLDYLEEHGYPQNGKIDDGDGGMDGKREEEGDL